MQSSESIPFCPRCGLSIDSPFSLPPSFSTRLQENEFALSLEDISATKSFISKAEKELARIDEERLRVEAALRKLKSRKQRVQKSLQELKFFIAPV